MIAGYGFGYALAGWGIAGSALTIYVTLLLQRGRRASKRVPAGKRRWSDPDVPA